MTRPFVPVDLQNPGQVFACLGFMEAAEVLCGQTQSEFDWTDPAQARFYLEVEDGADPFERVLGFLEACEVCGLVPESHRTLNMETWRLPTDLVPREQGFAMPPPSAPAMLPVRLRSGRDEIFVHHWGDATRRDKVKLWGGAGGLPGAVIFANTLELIRTQLLESRAAPFGLAAPLSSSFRLDWRRDYVPSEAGFSLNAQKNSIAAVGYPLVELLATVGLSHTRPYRPSSRDKLLYEYFVHGSPLAAVLQRALLGACNPVFPSRSFRIRLGWPGQENKERCITSVTETTASHA